VQSVGNDWYRISFTSAASSSTSGQVQLQLIQGTSTTSYTGDGASAVYLWGAQLEAGALPTSYIPTTSTINSAPRFDHNPTTGESLGLLVEEARTNLLQRSEEFDTTWTRTNITPFGSGSTTDAAVSPAGTQTADLAAVANGASAGTGFVGQTVSKAASAITYTYSVFAKADYYNRANLHVNDGATNNNRATVTVSLVNGGIEVAAAAVGTFSAASADVRAFPNGWYRIALTFTTSTETSLLCRLYPANSSADTSDGTRGIYFWGAQLEAGAFPTSYIPTTTAAAARSADVVSITGTAFSSWYWQDEGTIYVQGSTSASAANPILLNIEDGTVNERIQIRRIGASNLASIFVVDGGVGQGGATVSGFNADTIGRICTVYALNNLQLAFNGALGTADTSATIPTVDRAVIGSANSAGYANGHISRITYWPQALPSRLQSLTQ
jgi:hypothetical protein